MIGASRVELEEGGIWNRRASGRGGEVQVNGTGTGNEKERESLRGLDGAGLAIVIAIATGMGNGQTRVIEIGARVRASEEAEIVSVNANVCAMKRMKEIAPCASGVEKGIASIVVVTDPADVWEAARANRGACLWNLSGPSYRHRRRRRAYRVRWEHSGPHRLWAVGAGFDFCFYPSRLLLLPRHRPMVHLYQPAEPAPAPAPASALQNTLPSFSAAPLPPTPPAACAPPSPSSPPAPPSL